MTYSALALSCVVAVSAHAAITPVQCIRTSSAEVDGRGLNGPYGGFDEHERPFPAFPLDHYSLPSSMGVGDPVLASSADHDSTFLTGATVLTCAIRAGVNTGPYPAGTDATLVSYSAVAFDFSVDAPLTARIHSIVSAHNLNNGGYSESRVAILYGGQQVAQWSILDGGVDQEMLWTFTPGDWSVQASCVAFLGTDRAGVDSYQGRNADVSLDVQMVPAPASLALLGLMVMAGMSRRR